MRKGWRAINRFFFFLHAYGWKNGIIISGAQLRAEGREERGGGGEGVARRTLEETEYAI